MREWRERGEERGVEGREKVVKLKRGERRYLGGSEQKGVNR